MKRAIIVTIILVASLFVFAVPASAIESGNIEPQRLITVSTADELIEAIETVENGETIYVDRQITPEEGQTIGNPDKRITIMRTLDYSGYMVRFQAIGRLENITFDGGGIEGNAVLVDTAGVTIYNCTFTNFVGASYVVNVNYGSSLTVDDCVFTDNDVVYQLVFMCNNGNSIINSVFADNTAKSTVHNSGETYIADCTFIGCMSTGDYDGGGAIFNSSSGALTVERSIFTDNYATIRAGAIDNWGRLSLIDCLIYGNTGGNGANDIFCIDSATLTIRNTVDYSVLFADYDFSVLEWFHDSFDNRYSESNAIPFTVPVEDYYGKAGLIFIYQSTPDAEPNAPDYEPDILEPPQNPDGDGNTEMPPPTLNGNDNDTEQPETTIPDQTPPPYTPPSYGSYTSSHSSDIEDTTTTAKEPEQIASPFRCGKTGLDITSTAYLEGYGDGDLHEDDLLTRAQMVTIIYRLLTDESREVVYSDANQFDDCDPNAWYNDSVSTIANAGVVVGIGNGKFDPDGLLTWAQIVTIFARFVELQTDIEIERVDVVNHWAVDYVKTAIARGWIENDTDFSLDAKVTRGGMVRFINHIFAVELSRDAMDY